MIDALATCDPPRVPLLAAARIVVCLLMLPSLGWAHGGGLDANGCHHDRKAGGYHCHRGPQAGRSFSSKTEMQGGVPPAIQPFSAGVGATRPRSATGTGKGSIESRLQQLDRLRAKGLVTEGEYAEKRRAILDDL